MGKWGRDDSGEQSGTVKLHHSTLRQDNCIGYVYKKKKKKTPNIAPLSLDI